MVENIHYTEISDQELRLKCLEFVLGHEGRIDYPLYQMIQASILFRFIKEGIIPTASKTYRPNDNFADQLIQKALDVLIDERAKSNQATQGGNGNADNLDIPEHLVSRFLSRFRWKKAVYKG